MGNKDLCPLAAAKVDLFKSVFASYVVRSSLDPTRILDDTIGVPSLPCGCSGFEVPFELPQSGRAAQCREEELGQSDRSDTEKTTELG